jgi:hypothetical protein
MKTSMKVLFFTSTRVWSDLEDETFRDIMAITPRGTKAGVAKLLSSITHEQYDLDALAESIGKEIGRGLLPDGHR